MRSPDGIHRYHGELKKAYRELYGVACPPFKMSLAHQYAGSNITAHEFWRRREQK